MTFDTTDKVWVIYLDDDTCDWKIADRRLFTVDDDPSLCYYWYTDALDEVESLNWASAHYRDIFRNQFGDRT